MKQIYFSLNLNQSQYLKYYRGEIKYIQVCAENGKQIRFPAKLLHRFVTPQGIVGRFKMVYVAGKCQSIVRA